MSLIQEKFLYCARDDGLTEDEGAVMDALCEAVDAFEVLEREGYRYSSSVNPIRHDLYGMPNAPRFAFRPGPGDLWELPMTTVRLAGQNLPCSGGGYFRLMPYRLYRFALRRINQAERTPGIFYFHPWEIDTAQPRIRNCGPLAQFRHYVNIGRMHGRLERLLRDFRWDRIDSVFAPLLRIRISAENGAGAARRCAVAMTQPQIGEASR